MMTEMFNVERGEEEKNNNIAIKLQGIRKRSMIDR